VPYKCVVSAPLLAVDAPSMLFRAFYALPKTIIDPDKRPVNALLGAANLILREVELHEPRAVVLCFGPDAAAYRTELYPAYHAERDEAMPDELPHQLADSRDFFEAFGWTVTTAEDLEADDLLGTYARLEAEAGGWALLLTGDRDMYQCAGENVTVLYVRTGGKGAEEVGPAEVRERYGIGPELVPDFIALRGDPSDGLPGAKGVGPKTAAELLRQHGSLEAILDNAIRERRPALRGALIEGREELLAFKDIATLRDAGVERLPDRPTDWIGAAEAARERGMKRLAERLEKADPGRGST
jgi:5'-3' exonuclease